MELEEAAGERGVAASGGAGGSTGGDPDRLSALPDSLLHAIMSLLKARQAVQTCVLSTRWRHLWHWHLVSVQVCAQLRYYGASGKLM
jgi:hypothetical protein